MNEGGTLSLKTIRGWLSSPTVISYPLVIFVLVWPVITGFIGGETPGQEFAFSIHLYDFLGAAISSAILLLARAAFSVAPFSRIKSRAWPHIAALFAAAASGAVLPVVIVSSFSYVPDAYLQAVPFGVLSLFINMLIFIMFWNARKELRVAARELAVARKSLTFIKANLQSELAANQRALQKHVMAVLEPTIAQLTSEMKAGDGNIAVAASLRNSIDQVVRPLSYELAEAANSGPEQTMQTLRQFERAITKLPARERWMQRVHLSEVANVPLIILAQVAFIIPASTFLYGPQGSVASVISAITIAFANYAAVKTLASRVASYLRVLLLSVVVSVVSAVVYFAIVAVAVKQSSASLTLIVAVAVVITNFISGYINCQLAIRRVSLQLAAEVNNRLQAVVTQLKQDVWLNRRRMARVVHGSVQANLQAAAIRLIRGNKNGEVEPSALAQAVSESLSGVIFEQADQPGLSAAITALQEFWSGACELTVTVDADLLTRIEANNQAAECVYELISEATSNAIKHAAADEVDVHITDAGNAIEIEIRNAFVGSDCEATRNPAGYGSRIYDEITSSWSLTYDNTDAILMARLPLGS